MGFTSKLRKGIIQVYDANDATKKSSYIIETTGSANWDKLAEVLSVRVLDIDPSSTDADAIANDFEFDKSSQALIAAVL